MIIAQPVISERDVLRQLGTGVPAMRSVQPRSGC